MRNLGVMRRLRNETGSTVIAALLVSIIVFGLGTAVLQKVNAQTNQTAGERAREASFQVAESALNSTAQLVTRNFPSGTATAFTTCTNVSSPSIRCAGTDLSPNYTNTSDGGPRGGIEFSTAPQWETRVIDDVDGPSYYADALMNRSPLPCACDLSGGPGGTPNGFVWVRSSATVGGRNYVLVTLVGQGAAMQETLPRNAVTAGFFRTTNIGKKVMVDAKGVSATAGTVAVRCATSAPSPSDTCLGYDPAKGQLSPANAYKTNYVDGSDPPNATNRSALGAEALTRLKLRAQRLGTYYPAGQCPNAPAPLIYVENANCSYTGGTVNSAASPGMVIFGSGTLTFGGNLTFYGIVYMANGQGTAPSSGPCTPSHQNTVLSTTGTSRIQGAIFVDKCGGYVSGTSALNMTFDSNSFSVAISDGGSQVVKNGFRVVSSS